MEIFSCLFTFYLNQFQGINISELEGESYDNRKRKSAEDVEQDSEEQLKKSKKQNGTKVEKKFPGQFVLLKPPQDDDDDDQDDDKEDEIFSKPEASAIRNVRYFRLFFCNSLTFTQYFRPGIKSASHRTKSSKVSSKRTSKSQPRSKRQPSPSQHTAKSTFSAQRQLEAAKLSHSVCPSFKISRKS